MNKWVCIASICLIILLIPISFIINRTKNYKVKLLYCRSSDDKAVHSFDKLCKNLRVFTPSILNGFFINGEKFCLRTIAVRFLFWIMTLGRARIFYLTDDDGELMHTSYLVPHCFKFPFMSKFDYEIGPCYTYPKYRGCGLYPMVISNIYLLFNKQNTNFYMIIDEKNISSIRGVEKAGFVKCGEVYISKFKRYYIVKSLK